MSATVRALWAISTFVVAHAHPNPPSLLTKTAIDPSESSSAEDTPIPTTTPRRSKKATRAQDAMSEDEAAPPRKTPRRESKVAAAAVDDPMDEDVAEGGENGEEKEAGEGMDVDEDEEEGEEEEYGQAHRSTFCGWT